MLGTGAQARLRQLTCGIAFLVIHQYLVAAATLDTRCRLTIFGNNSSSSSREDISGAQLTCTGPSLSAEADPLLLKYIADSPGVAWRTNGCGAPPGKCLLSICGNSSVTIEAAVIQGIQLSTINHTLCVLQGSSALMANSVFESNAAAMVLVEDASLQLINATVRDNSCTRLDQAGPGVTAQGNSTRTVEGSYFGGNTHALRDGPAIYIAGGTRATVVSSTFNNNSATCSKCGAGAMRVVDSATGKPLSMMLQKPLPQPVSDSCVVRLCKASLIAQPLGWGPVTFKQLLHRPAATGLSTEQLSEQARLLGTLVCQGGCFAKDLAWWAQPGTTHQLPLRPLLHVVANGCSQHHRLRLHSQPGTAPGWRT